MTDEKPPAAAEAEKPAPKPPEERESVTEGKTGRVPYRATAATVNLRDDAGKVKASLFHVSYVRTDVKDPRTRPVTFAFNGGPGSSSVWLHLGLFGPRRVVFGDAATPPPPPYELVENEYTLLDDSDLVLIDPVTTGWSRAAEGEDGKQFHGLDEDTKWVGEFIRLWLSRNHRWESPKFLMGESYGTTRSASLSFHLADKLGIYVNGIALISTILFFQTARWQLGNDLPYVLFLPTMAATAWYHGRIDRTKHGSLRALVDEVEGFALGTYATTLLGGSRAGATEVDEVAGRLAEYTGLSREFIDRCDLRVSPDRFYKELLRDQRRTVGRLDSRFTGIDRDAAGEGPEYDAAYAIIQPVYTAAVNDYLRRDLGFESDLLYDVISDKVRPWATGPAGDGQYVEVGSRLRSALNRNRAMTVFMASGYYDFATPFAAAEWTLDHLGLDESLRQNLTMTRYEAGHMMYIHEPSIAQFRKDLRRWMKRTLKGPEAPTG